MDCKQKKNLWSIWIRSGGSRRKKLKKSHNKDLHEAAFTWFKNARSTNIPANRIIIKVKALSLTKNLELTDLRTSDGWLDK